jgi:diguanylate cyclase (GGDEF)-like protein/PAS domain S-box-containing protein
MSRLRFFKGFGLGSYLALMIGMLIVALTVVIVAIVHWHTTGDMMASIGRDLEELAFQTTDKLDRGLFERYREVQLLAERSLLGESSLSPESKRELLELRQQTYPNYAWIGLTDKEGKVIAATGKLLEGVDVSKRPWFGDAYRGIYLHDVHEAVLLAKLLPKTDGEPQRFFDVAFPFRDANGQYAGVLGTHLSWQWAKEVEASVLRPMARRSKVETLIVNSKGAVLLGPKALMGKQISQASLIAAQRRNSGFTVERWPDGEQYLVGYSKSQGYLAYPGLGWTVLVRQNVDAAYAPVVTLQRTILLIGLTLAVLFSLIGFLAARKITRPVEEIARAARALEKGEASSMQVDSGPYREIRSLSGTLNSLLSKLAEKENSLRTLNASLEDRVRERTEELGKALDSLALEERALRDSQQRLATITDNMPAGILYIDREQRFRFVNRTYLKWNRATLDSLLGKTLAEIFTDDYDSGARYAAIEANVKRALAGERVQFEVERVLDGALRHAELTYIPDKSGDQVVGFYTMIQDITDRKNAQLHFEHHASHDSLTGLPNRRMFMERLEQALLRAKRSQKPLAVLFLDLNKFKLINDTLGHAAGDGVLVDFANTLSRCVRKTDTVGRLAGDEFIILAEELFGGASDAILIAEKIISAQQAMQPLGAQLGRVSSSIGIAVSNQENESADALVARADQAMYESKKLAGGWALG